MADSFLLIADLFYCLLIYFTDSWFCWQISSPYLEDYLKRCASGPADIQLQSLEVLWRYYEKNRDYIAAAKILNTLAVKPGYVLLNSVTRYTSSARNVLASQQQSTCFGFSLWN